jgi:hypothetical protein
MTFAISRRTAIRGLGCAIALPWLEAMTKPARAFARAEAPRRTVFVFLPNGVNRAEWFPSQVGPIGTWPSSLAPLKPFAERLTVLSGFAHVNAEPHGDGPGDHARSAACFLTGAHPRKTSGSDIANGVSIDQVIAMRHAGRTPIDSLELGLEPGMTAGNCDSGYSCAYSANISWRGPHTPMAKEHDPRALFERLFAIGSEQETETARARRIASRASILDGARDEARRLRDGLGGTDRRKLDEYLDGVRSVERRIELAERSERRDTEDLPAKPTGVPAEWTEHARLMSDLLVLAFRLDLTRVATLMLANEGSNRPYPTIGVHDGHHDVSHHDRDPDKLAKFAAINRLHTEQFAYLLGRLAAEREGEGSLLDATMLVFGGAIGDGNAHDHRDLPIVLAGGRPDESLAAAHGTHRRLVGDVPLCDLFVSLAARAGAPVERFGDSRGPVRL